MSSSPVTDIIRLHSQLDRPVVTIARPTLTPRRQLEFAASLGYPMNIQGKEDNVGLEQSHINHNTVNDNQDQSKDVSVREAELNGADFLVCKEETLDVSDIIQSSSENLTTSSEKEKLALPLLLASNLPDPTAETHLLANVAASLASSRSRSLGNSSQDNSGESGGDVNDEETQKYYEDNKSRFTKPVLYRVNHIHLATVKPSGEAEDEASKKKAARLTKMINEEAKEKINSLLRKVKAGGNFAELAKEFSEDEASREQGGYLGDLHPDSTIPEIGKEMLKLKEGETSGVIQSQFGYHILKLDEIIPSKLIPFEETKTDIMNLLLKKKTRELFTKYVEDLGNKADIRVFI